MSRRSPFRLLSLLVCLVLPAAKVAAQESLAGCVNWQRLSRSAERVSENHWRFTGSPLEPVEIECDETRFFADEMEIFTDTNIATARGNVVFVSGGNRIAADRMEFNTKTRTGVFYDAQGTASLNAPTERSLFGTQEPDAYFWGEELHKLGPRTYRVTRGGFTTCVQPTPRWEISSGSATITLDSRAVLVNPVLRVKGVPLLYLPVMYYPLEEDDRSTGFLIPTYGASTLRGQSISNAFFWAISRSQDATLFHDWFTQTGMGYGGEYRYVAAPGSEGYLRTYFLNEHEAELVQGGGAPTVVPARRSYEIRSNVTQALPAGLRARGRVDYFSSLEVQRQYHQDIYDASRRQRSFGFNVTGAWGPYLMSTTLDRSEVFYDTTSSTIVGAMPRISLSRSERPIGNSPVYFAVSGEAATLLRRSLAGDTERDNGLTRLDLLPSVRVPFTRWPFLTVNTSFAWRATYWTESLDSDRRQIEKGLTRQFFDLTAQVTGPTFTRIWDTPGNAFAQKFKHVIEPSLTVQRVSPIDVFDQIVRLEGSDYIVGRVTRLNYALTNRLYAKPHEGGTFATPREFLNVAISQSYYTDANAARYDRDYATSFDRVPPSHFSPIALVARVNPTATLSGQFRTEYDTQFHAFRSFTASGSVSLGAWLRASGGWSQRRFVEGLPGFSDPNRRDHFINASTTRRTPDGRVGGTYVFNYDLFRDYFLQQRLVGYYNAQCCGVAAEYQVYNLLFPDPRTGLTYDRRFNLSFTLAGVGTFSNLFGAFGGNQGR